jgi:hypothetical protein
MRWNTFLTGVVLLFAFLASSFAASNSDFWSHLAAGRLLYLLYTVVGDSALVVLKALLITVLAWLLLHLRRPDGGAAWPAACTLLALLVLVPHLLLQPAILSYLFVGLTLWLLWRPHRIEERQAPRSFSRDLKRFGILPFLMALWGNVDGGIFFGLLLVGLFWLGVRAAAPRFRLSGPPSGRRRHPPGNRKPQPPTSASFTRRRSRNTRGTGLRVGMFMRPAWSVWLRWRLPAA